VYSSPLLKKEADPVSETLFSSYLEFRTTDEVQEPINYECYTPSSQSSWIQIQRSGLDSRRYQIFGEAVGLERRPLSLVSTAEGLLGKEVETPVCKTEITAVGISSADNVAPSIHKKKIAFIYFRPIAVVERSKARTVFARSNTAIVGSNPT
jgi:hypothetical protein